MIFILLFIVGFIYCFSIAAIVVLFIKDSEEKPIEYVYPPLYVDIFEEDKNY